MDKEVETFKRETSRFGSISQYFKIEMQSVKFQLDVIVSNRKTPNF